MSRPTTRSKNKRQKPEGTVDHPSEILRKIHITGEISESDIHQLYSVSKPVCEGCRTNLKDSPNCFCGLIPASNGTRKSGLWQKMSEIISSLGADPCKDVRSSIDTPAGLTNVGATCYANSILQCLYMNKSFRAGIFSVKVDLLNNHPVLDQLCWLFAQLHSSRKAFIDSAPFIKTLELDNGVQQDSHEFLTLFLSLLERSLNHSMVAKTRNMVQDLFRGRVSHVTRCSVCGRDSEASLKMEDFYELELNIKGLTNLHQSLEDYLSLEELHGENQYFCESCATRVNATRSIKLRELPSVLNFQLKRYVFLPKTTTKKKITTMFSFPRQLNMDRILGEQGESALVYELSAILIHKGTATNSGHYVAHIKDENTGQWWEFDDEHVSKLGSHPFGEESSKASAKPVLSVDLNCHKQVGSLPNGTNSSNTQPSALDDDATTGEEIFSSSDAYMLMYNHKKIKESNNITCKESGLDNIDLGSNGSSNIPCKESGSDVMDMGNSLPLHFYEEIQKLNASYVHACEEYQVKKDGHVAFITEQRQEVKSILSEASVHSLEQPYFWVSMDWLRQWADSIKPPCLDNSVIQCIHGKVPFTKVHSMKRVSHAAWHKLLSKYGGGPTLTNETYCTECIKDGAKSAICADDYRDRRASMKQIAEAALAGSYPDDNLYYVSKTWLLQWLRRKNVDCPCEVDAGPTASLRCPHASLLPDQAAGAKRVLVPESLWLFLCESANMVKPDDLVGCDAFSADSNPCEVCSRELTEVACLEDCLRAIKFKQRQNHEKLFLGKSFALYPGCKYFLMPSAWLTNWRAYVTTTGKNISSSAEPEMLEVSIDSLICEKHSQLLERPLELVCKRGVITQKLSPTDGLTLVPEHDWILFCEEWNVTQGKGIHAEIHFSNDASNKLAGSCKEKPISEAEMYPSNNDANDDLEARKPFVRTHPEVCEDCIGERESCELMRKLNYCDEDIRVFLVLGKEAPKSLLEASGTFAKPDRRTSKRSRKSSYGNSVNLKVSSSTSIYQLKMMIWESFGVVKENQKLHKGSAEIEDDIATLADKSIFPGDVLWVTDTEIYENRDIVDELSEQKIELRKTEEGFRGSLLTSDAPVQEWQDLESLS